MDPDFCQFPQAMLWPELRDHLRELAGVRETNVLDDPMIGSWVRFEFHGHSFTIHAEDGRFIFSVDDPDCPKPVLDQVASHFRPLFDDGVDSAQRRV